MRSDPPLESELARIRRATDAIEPPPDFAAEVMARVGSRAPRSVTMGATPTDPGGLASSPSTPRSGLPAAEWLAQLSFVGRRFVPIATLAAAAAVALAWSVQTTLDETAPSALDIAQDLP